MLPLSLSSRNKSHLRWPIYILFSSKVKCICFQDKSPEKPHRKRIKEKPIPEFGIPISALLGADQPPETVDEREYDTHDNDPFNIVTLLFVYISFKF